MTGRPPALSPEQKERARLRLAAGERAADIAADLGVSRQTILRLSDILDKTVMDVAKKVAQAQTELSALPIQRQHQALTLAEKLRSISDNLAAAAMHGAATAHRLNALANSEVAKVDDADPLASLDALRGVGVLSKLANDSASVAINLLTANKPAVQRMNEPEPPPPAIDPTKLSAGALQELLAARDAAAGRN